MIKILVIEDCPVYRLVLKVLFNSYPFEVHYSTNAEEAWHLPGHTSFDLVLSDYNLPGMSGYELLCHLRENKLAPVLILMTANRKVENECPRLQCIVDHLMYKPFLKKTLDSIISKYLRS